MKAILFTGAREEGSAATSTAEAVVGTYADLVANVDRLLRLGPAHCNRPLTSLASCVMGCRVLTTMTNHDGFELACAWDRNPYA